MKLNGGSIDVGSMWAKQAVKATPSSAYSEHLLYTAMELDYNM
jgi:hypothetical protein